MKLFDDSRCFSHGNLCPQSPHHVRFISKVNPGDEKCLHIVISVTYSNHLFISRTFETLESTSALFRRSWTPVSSVPQLCGRRNPRFNSSNRTISFLSFINVACPVEQPVNTLAFARIHTRVMVVPYRFSSSRPIVVVLFWRNDYSEGSQLFRKEILTRNKMAKQNRKLIAR
jgi:hypothetical protein